MAMYGLRDEFSSFNKRRGPDIRARVRSFLDRRKEGYAGVKQKLKGIAGYMPEAYYRATSLGGGRSKETPAGPTPLSGRGVNPGERMREVAGTAKLPRISSEITPKRVANVLEVGGKALLKSGGNPLLAAGAAGYEVGQKLKGPGGTAPEALAQPDDGTQPLGFRSLMIDAKSREPDLTKRATEVAAGGKFQPDFNKAWWWLDERLGKSKPIRVIQGTESHWVSPITGGSYATPKEAYEGVGIDVKAVQAERTHELAVERLKGRYGLLEQQAKPFKRYEELGSSPMGEPSILDQLTGGVSTPGAGLPGGAQEGLDAVADALSAAEPEVAATQLASIPDKKQRNAIFNLLPTEKQKKILKIWRSL